MIFKKEASVLNKYCDDVLIYVIYNQIISNRNQYPV